MTYLTRRLRQTLRFAVFVPSLLFIPPLHAESSNQLSDLIAALTPEVAEPAIENIPDPARKLLALRSYLRAGNGLTERWSWTEKEIADYQGSPEQALLLAEVDRIKAHFSEHNPGFELYTNTRVRSLDVQLAHWNENESVGMAAEELFEALETETLFEQAEQIDPKEVGRWLRGFRNTQRAHLAAPGLTRHGRAHAIDFQIMQDGKIYAGADSGQIETVWRAEGWDAALKASIEAAGPSFSGPLTSPDEPWHYDYQPATDAAQISAGQ